MGADSGLWQSNPELAIVIATTMPGGTAAICEARWLVESLCWGVGWRGSPTKPPTVVHKKDIPLPLATVETYIGTYKGKPGVCPRPSPWSSPFGTPKEYDIWLSSRADLPDFLAPLGGRVLVSDHSHEDCHGSVLIAWYKRW